VARKQSFAFLGKGSNLTACAIDRLIHHAVILEMTGPSFRSEAARKRGDATPTTTTDQTPTTTPKADGAM
jgi:hypothetical protein